MVGRTARRLRDHALKPQSPQIQLVDERLDDPDLVLLRYKVVEILRKQNALPPILTLDKALHQEPDLIRQDFTSNDVFTQPAPEADFDLTDPFSRVPELKVLPPGPAWHRVAMERILVGDIPAQHAGLRRLLDSFGPDVIVGDDMFFGVLPMLLGARSKRPPVVLCGTSILHWPREDGAPMASACRRRQRPNSVRSTLHSRGTITRPSSGLWAFA